MSLTGYAVLEKTDYGDYSTTIDVSQLKPGLYIVRIYFKSGEVVSQKFVKK